MSEIFSPAATSKAIHASVGEALAAIPEGRTHVLLFDGTYAENDGAGARVLYAHKTADGWGVVFDAAYDQPHGLTGRVATAKSW